MADTAPDYRSTVFLPETDFPMRAGLPQREPDWLARWERIGMAVIAVTVAKVFLIDASGLTGLTRVFSFLGLGLSLAG
ncbi:MAG: DUF2339 domain-containing protein, partial [Candidatus Saccharibacteria bacterium]|nr:DUF2339 domain-containing protein [Pseudorhodobacter sp.]